MKISFILHGQRKLKRIHREFISRCQKMPGFVCTFTYTTSGGHAIELAKEAKSSADVVIVHGGDGLLNEVINGLCSIPGKHPKLLILPGGTGNDFCRNFAPIDLIQPLEVFGRPGTPVTIPYLKTEGALRFFINIADLGFGGAVVASLNAYRQRFGPSASYFLAILKTFTHYKAQELELSFNGKTQTQPFFMIALCNGAVFGNGLTIAPGKHPRSAHFQAVLLGRVSLWDYLWHLPKLIRGKRIVHPEIHYHETTSLTIRATSGTLSGETDGELILGTSFEFGLSEHIISVLN
jgi:YegS/Rv2252/BmrU family lipid kinase